MFPQRTLSRGFSFRFVKLSQLERAHPHYVLISEIDRGLRPDALPVARVIKLSHFLVEVGLVPLIQWSMIDSSEAFLSTLTYDTRKLLLKISKFPLVARVLEALHSIFVWLAIGNYDRSLAFLLLLFTFSCSWGSSVSGIRLVLNLDITHTICKTLLHLVESGVHLSSTFSPLGRDLRIELSSF